MAGLSGTPVIILKDTRRESGRDAIHNNVMAARAVANAVRSTLGPKGMDKMLVDSLGDVTITSDGVTVLKEMEVQHPAAKMIIEAAKTQDSEVGDGTTTVAIFAGELLKKAEELLDQGVHPTVIVEGYGLSSKKALKILDSIAIEVQENDKEILKKIANTAMSGKLSGDSSGKMAEYAVEIVQSAIETIDGKKKVDLDKIKVEKKAGEGIEDSELISGVVVDKTIVHQNMPKKIEKAKIALLSAPIEVRDTETKAEIQITSSSQLQLFMDQEKEAIKSVVDKVLASGANVVFCQKGIEDLAQHYLADAGVLALRRVNRSDLDRLSRATGANIVTSLEELKPSDLGTSELVEEKRIGNGYMVFVTGTKNDMVTLVLRGGTQQVLDGLERALDDAIHAVACVIEDRKVLPGGGATEVEMALQLREYAASLKGREQLAVAKFAEAIEIIPKALAENGGFSSIDKMAELRKVHDTDKRAGIDVYSGQIENMYNLGIIEPWRTKVQAIQSATDASSLILRIDDVLASTKKKPEEGEPGAGRMPGGMQGMGMGGMPGMGGMGMPGMM